MAASVGQDFGDDEIFYGSVRATLKRVPGRSVCYEFGKYAPDASRDAQGLPARTLARKDPIPHPSDQGPRVVVPCMPCLDAVRIDGDGERDGKAGEAGALQAWPEVLRQPLIKTHPRSDGEGGEDGDDAPASLKAFASGCRSACVKINGRWYRLKGSGNNDDGFIVETSQTVLAMGEPMVLTRQIRGAAFEHTAICENHYSATLAHRLAPAGVLGTNTAMGYYLYDGDAELPLGREHPAFQTACIVEETRGDRRLGAHVLTGIALLLPQLLSPDQLDVDALRAAFPDAHRKSGGNLGPQLGPVWLFDESAELGVLPASGLFGALQIFCSGKFMTRQCTGKAREQAWEKVKEQMKAWDSVEGSDGNTNRPPPREIADLLKFVLSSRLVGSVSDLSEAINELTDTAGLMGIIKEK
eukprot:g2398.t1